MVDLGIEQKEVTRCRELLSSLASDLVAALEWFKLLEAHFQVS